MVYSGGLVVASPKPRDTMKLIIAMLFGGLVGAFVSMFLMQESYELHISHLSYFIEGPQLHYCQHRLDSPLSLQLEFEFTA